MMKTFKFLLFFLILSSSSSILAEASWGEILNFKPKQPKVKSTGATSLLKSAEMEAECDDVTYFKDNYGVFKDELQEYKTAWIERKDAIMPRLETLFIGAFQLFVGSICFYETYQICIGKQKIVERKLNLYSAIMAGTGAHQWHNAYKNFKDLYQWRLVAHKKITNTENALKKLEIYKNASELR